MRFLSPLLAVIFLLGACAALDRGGQGAAGKPPILDDRQLLVLTARDPDVTVQAVRPLGYAVQRIDPLDGLGETLIDLRIPAGRSVPEAIAEVEGLLPETTAGANHAYRLQADDLDFARSAIGWPEQGCTARRKIGLIDAGVPADHPALADGRIVQAVLHQGDARPRSRHGALMADLLVGEGRLTGAQLYSANAIDPATRGDLAGVDAILRSLDWLQDEKVEVINISLAGPFNKLLNRAMGTAARDGVVFVAAAGNQGASAPPQYPAAFPFVLAVTAVDAEGAAYRRAVRGTHIDLAAPGVDVVVRAQGRARVASGTSVAAPFVTTTITNDAALPFTNNVGGVRAYLGRRAEDLGPPGHDRVFGAGLVRAPETCRAP